MACNSSGGKGGSKQTVSPSDGIEVVYGQYGESYAISKTKEGSIKILEAQKQEMRDMAYGLGYVYSQIQVPKEITKTADRLLTIYDQLRNGVLDGDYKFVEAIISNQKYSKAYSIIQQGSGSGFSPEGKKARKISTSSGELARIYKFALELQKLSNFKE